MKKVIFLITMILSVSLLSGCTDTKIVDDSITVVFYAFERQENVTVYRDIERGTLIAEPENPIKTGSTFLNWSTSARENIPFNFNTPVTSSITLYAFFTTGSYTIQYELNDGIFTDPLSVIYEVESGETVFLPRVTRVGYEFDGWYLNPINQLSIGERPIQSIENVLDNYTVYAKWSPRKILIKFNSNTDGVTGVSNPPQRLIEYGSVIDLPVLQDTDTHKFIGWRDSSGVMYINGEIFTRVSSGTFLAVWELKS